MISVDEAIAILAGHRPETPAELEPLACCLGRVLAEDVAACVSAPPYAVSAMDGYAVRLEDAKSAGAEFEIIGEAPAGTPFDGHIGKGMAVRIFTGARIPEGADHVVIQEDVVRQGKRISVPEPQIEASHIRHAGIDFHQGDILLQRGRTLGPAAIAAAAAADHASLPVLRKPRIAFLANGDELREPGTDPAEGDIIASNYPALNALVSRWGCETIDCGIARDNVDDICERIALASTADIIVPIGGASVGDHDHMFAAFEQMGLQSVFRKIAVRPGKPTWFGLLRRQRVLGLPGNPASALVCAQIFLRSLVDGGDTLDPRRAALTGGLAANGPRETFLRARLSYRQDGSMHVTALPRQDSSLITPFLEADCLIRRAANAQPLNLGDLTEIFMMTL